MSRHLLGITLVGILVLSSMNGISSHTKALELSTDVETQNNVILLIGDGMGWNQLYSGMLVEYGNMSASVIPEFTHVNISTLNFGNYTTDSAAAATAIASGVKTRNSYLGKDPDGNDVPTIAEQARDFGLNTALITTVTMEHATPGGFGAHTTDRGEYRNIAAQMARQEFTILMGGGSGSTDFGDQISYMEDLNYTYVQSESEMNAVTTLPVLGLYNTIDLPYEITRTSSTTEPQLSDMLAKSLELLSNEDKGFFVMAEGGKIDWAAHDNDFTTMIHEVIQFEKTVRVALEFAKTHTNTLVIVTADHETGDLTDIIPPTSFDSRVPADNDSIETKIELRTNRSTQIGYSWGRASHSDQNVILGSFGVNSQLIANATHHIDTYQVMNQTLFGSLYNSNGNSVTPTDSNSKKIITLNGLLVFSILLIQVIFTKKIKISKFEN